MVHTAPSVSYRNRVLARIVQRILWPSMVGGPYPICQPVCFARQLKLDFALTSVSWLRVREGSLSYFRTAKLILLTLLEQLYDIPNGEVGGAGQCPCTLMLSSSSLAKSEEKEWVSALTGTLWCASDGLVLTHFFADDSRPIWKLEAFPFKLVAYRHGKVFFQSIALRRLETSVVSCRQGEGYSFSIRRVAIALEAAAVLELPNPAAKHRISLLALFYRAASSTFASNGKSGRFVMRRGVGHPKHYRCRLEPTLNSSNICW